MIENKDMMFIGQQLVYRGGGWENIAINMSDYTTTMIPPTTESPGKGDNLMSYHTFVIPPTTESPGKGDNDMSR